MARVSNGIKHTTSVITQYVKQTMKDISSVNFIQYHIHLDNSCDNADQESLNTFYGIRFFAHNAIQVFCQGVLTLICDGKQDCYRHYVRPARIKAFIVQKWLIINWIVRNDLSKDLKKKSVFQYVIWWSNMTLHLFPRRSFSAWCLINLLVWYAYFIMSWYLWYSLSSL